MDTLKTADLCAQLDTMRQLCDQLHAAQDDNRKSRVLVERIRREADALRETVCGLREQEEAAGQR